MSEMISAPGAASNPAASPMAKDFVAIAALIDRHEKTYLRRRALLEGPERNGPAHVEDVASELSGLLGDRLSDFTLWAQDNLAGLKRITLISAALLALRRGAWDASERLAREVTARDHHDLMAQRIVDAATEQAVDLQTETDRWLQGRICKAPFRQMETRTDRSVHFCCSAWQPVPIGKISDETVSEGGGFWFSPQAREIRRSVSEGDFSYCSRWHCPAIANRRLPARMGAGDKASPAALAAPPILADAGRGPKRIILSHDRSCNISCPSCRTQVILANHQATRDLDRMFEVSLLPFLAEAEDIKVTGSGDPFGSRHFRHVLKLLCAEGTGRRRIQLHSNGLLANRRAWDELGLWDNVSSVWISVDAARPETYAILRRGGDFADLLENLRFLGGLNQSGAIDSLRLDFVVQQQNVDQLAEFVDLAESIGADGVYFLRLRNWGHFSAEAFRAMDVCDPSHPQHPALLAELADPRMTRPSVDLGSLASLRGRPGL